MSITEKPIFIPLKRAYFEQFEAGTKTIEYRLAGPRWNSRTCRIGRKVVLSLGYGKARRLQAEVVDFCTDTEPEKLPGWRECYGDIPNDAACITLKIIPN